METERRGSARAAGVAFPGETTPADRDSGSPAPVESPSEVEARVAALEAELRVLNQRLWNLCASNNATMRYNCGIIRKQKAELARRIETARAATGGNEKLSDCP